jgi:hypothetical protein
MAAAQADRPMLTALGGHADAKRLLAHAAFWCALAVGVVMRCLPPVRADFPLNDGGLITSMVVDLQRAGYQLPLQTSYNGGGIPFAAPPLAVYLAAGIAELTRIDLTALLRILPLVCALSSMPLFWVLARTLLSSTSGAAVAVAGFALLPAAYFWLLMGSGVVRGPGLLGALLALSLAAQLYRHGTIWRAVPTGALMGLAALCDGGSAWFVGISLPVSAAVGGRSPRPGSSASSRQSSRRRGGCTSCTSTGSPPSRLHGEARHSR